MVWLQLIVAACWPILDAKLKHFAIASISSE